MKKAHRELVGYLARHGIHVARVEQCRKHMKMTLGNPGGPVMVTAGSPSDGRWKRNCLKVARRLLLNHCKETR